MIKKNKLFLFSATFAIYGYLSINIGLPAYPTLQHVFSIDSSHMKLSMTVFLLAYAVSQLVWGPLSDRYGRRPITLVASIIAISGSLLTALAISFPFFITGRFIEGLGTGFTTVIARVIASDTLDAKGIHKTMTYIVATVAIMPAIAPLIGGQILYWLNWRTIYYFLTLAGVIIGLATWLYLGETIKHKTAHFSLKHSGGAYLSLLKHLRFMGYFLPVCFTLGGLVTFYAVAPYIFVNHLHIAANHYGYILLIVGLSYVLGAILARVGSKKLSANHLLCIGFTLALISSLALPLLNQLYTLKVLTVLLPMICYAISCGFISPISNTCALAAIDTNKGSAAALLGSGSMLVSSLLTAILAHFSMSSLYPLGIVLTLTIVLSIVVCYSANRLSSL